MNKSLFEYQGTAHPPHGARKMAGWPKSVCPDCEVYFDFTKPSSEPGFYTGICPRCGVEWEFNGPPVQVKSVNALKIKMPCMLNRRVMNSRPEVLEGLPCIRQKTAYPLREPETCWVDGCKEPAYVMPYLFKSYPMGGISVSHGVDPDCPFLCIDHFLEDAEGMRAVYTNRKRRGNYVDYRLVLHPKDKAVG